MDTNISSPTPVPLTRDGEPPEPPMGKRDSLATASSILSMLTFGTAPFLSAFLVVHLAAPVAANLGGSSLASSVMLLGREYYQTTFGERFLLLVPFAIHTSSSICKRVLITIHRNKGTLKRLLPAARKADPDTATLDLRSERTTSPKARSPPPRVPPIRRVTSLLSVSAYTALFVFIPIHVATHRWAPLTGSSSLISAPGLENDPVGPSELDFEFVKTALQKWPWRSWILYTGLVGCTLVHAHEGLSLVWAKSRRWARPRLGATSDDSSVGSPKPLAWLGSAGKRKTIKAAGFAALPVLTGLLVLSREPLLALSSLVGRYENTFMSSWVYRV